MNAGFIKNVNNFSYMLRDFLAKLNFFFLRTLLGGVGMCVNVLDYVMCVGAKTVIRVAAHQCSLYSAAATAVTQRHVYDGYSSAGLLHTSHI